MTRLSDEQLGRHLDRRTSSAPLAGSEREELVASIAQQAATAPQVRRGFDLFARRVLPAAAAMAAVVVVAALVLQLPRADQLPGSSPSATRSVGASPVLTTSELASTVMDPTAEGQVVLADTWINEVGADKTLCGDEGDATKPCPIGTLADAQPSVPVIAHFRSVEPFREYDLPPIEPGLLGFQVLADGLEYLGPLLNDGESMLWTVADARATEELADDPHSLLAVTGWLVGSPAPRSCPPAVWERSDHRYWCGKAAMLTPEHFQPTTVTRSGDGTSVSTRGPADGQRIQVQNGAYDKFAPEPQFGEYGTTEPRRGVYLIRRVGCPTGIPKLSCPVWEMVARLDPGGAEPAPSQPSVAQPSATPTSEPLSPTPVASTASPIPTTIDGGPVLTDEAITAYIAAATDDTPFLLGGWISHIQADCFVPDDFPTTPLLAPCGDGVVMARIRLVLLTDVAGFQSAVPIVLRVHVHDPLAADCPPDYRERCDEAVVVDEVAWTGSEPRLGQAYAYRLHTHCGLRPIEFAGSSWVADAASEASWSRTDDPFEDGTLSLLTDDLLRYDSVYGSAVLFNRTENPPSYPPCY